MSNRALDEDSDREEFSSYENDKYKFLDKKTDKSNLLFAASQRTVPARWPGLALHFESHALRRAQREKTPPSRIDLIAKHNFISACIPPRVIPLRGRSTEGPEPIFSR